MKKKVVVCGAVATLAAMVALGGSMDAQAAFFSGNNSVTVSSPVSEDAFVAGSNVTVNAPVFGELITAGSVINVDAEVDRSIVAAGSSVNINQGAGYNAYLAGNAVTIDGQYGHDVYIAGGDVIVKEGTVIAGDLRVGAAENLTLAGTVEGDVIFNGGHLDSSATIGGKLTVKADQGLTFTGGSIGGDLDYTVNGQVIGLDTVIVAGNTVSQEWREEFNGTSSNQVVSWLFRLVSLLGLGAVVCVLAPRKVNEVREAVVNRWSQSFTTGVASLLAIPVLSLLFFATIIGWRIGLFLLLGYALSIAVAGVIGLVVAGDFILRYLRREGKSAWLSLMVGTVAVVSLEALPIGSVGTLIKFVFIIFLFVPTYGALLFWLRKQVS